MDHFCFSIFSFGKDELKYTLSPYTIFSKGYIIHTNARCRIIWLPGVTFFITRCKLNRRLGAYLFTHETLEHDAIMRMQWFTKRELLISIERVCFRFFFVIVDLIFFEISHYSKWLYLQINAGDEYCCRVAIILQ